MIPIHAKQFKDNLKTNNNSLMKTFKMLYNLSNKYDILYVEDEPNSRLDIGQLFKDLFNRVDFAENGHEALSLYLDYNDENHKCYDIVITDIEMPVMDGIELCKNIFQLYEDQQIIVLSAHDQSECLIELINMGVHGFLQKPFEKNKTLEILYNMCEKLDHQLELTRVVKLNNGFVWNSDLKTLSHEGEDITLCASETSLLDLLISNRNITFSIDDIFNVVYNDYFEKDLSVDSVKSLLKRIRKKVPSDLIKNIYGEGYRINQKLFIA